MPTSWCWRKLIRDKLAIRDKCTKLGSSRKDRLKSVLGNCTITFVFLLPVGAFAVVFFSRVCVGAFTATLHHSSREQKLLYGAVFFTFSRGLPVTMHMVFFVVTDIAWDWKYFNPSFRNASLKNIIIVDCFWNSRCVYILVQHRQAERVPKARLTGMYSASTNSCGTSKTIMPVPIRLSAAYYC